MQQASRLTVPCPTILHPPRAVPSRTARRDQHAGCDFLYEDELRKYQGSGLLTRLDTAFSRDGARKIYVQDRMRENAGELWAWLERGAYFYVGGDAARMAADVDRALHEVIVGAGAMDESAAKAFVQDMIASKRYVRDVY